MFLPDLSWADGRLAIEVSKALNDIPSTKRDGNDMTRNVRYTLHLDENKSSHRANSVLRQESLLHQLEEEMENREEDVVERFEKLRNECNRLAITAGLMKVIKVERLRINIIADVLTLNKPVSAWENFLPSVKVSLTCSQGLTSGQIFAPYSSRYRNPYSSRSPSQRRCTSILSVKF